MLHIVYTQHILLIWSGKHHGIFACVIHSHDSTKNLLLKSALYLEILSIARNSPQKKGKTGLPRKHNRLKMNHSVLRWRNEMFKWRNDQVTTVILHEPPTPGSTTRNHLHQGGHFPHGRRQQGVVYILSPSTPPIVCPVGCRTSRVKNGWKRMWCHAECVCEDLPHYLNSGRKFTRQTCTHLMNVRPWFTECFRNVNGS